MIVTRYGRRCLHHDLSRRHGTVPAGSGRHVKSTSSSSSMTTETGTEMSSSTTGDLWNRVKHTLLPDETTPGRGTANGSSSSSSPPPQPPKPQKSKLVVDVKPTSTMKSHEGRLPHGKSTASSSFSSTDHNNINNTTTHQYYLDQEEFPPDTAWDRKRISAVATRRIVRIAANRVLEPSAMTLLTLSTSAVLGIGAMEATLLTSHVPFVESMDAGYFICRYALEQLLPSCVWETQDAKVVATAMGYDPAVLLQALQPELVAADATTVLRVQLLASTRCMAAGFMLLSQLVRAGTIGASAISRYESRIKAGREPPIVVPGSGGGTTHGLVIRFCGRESNVTETSLRRMGRHLFPIFEEPESIQHLVKEFSHGKKVPMYWCVRPGRYGTLYSWQGFDLSKNHEDCYVRTLRTGQKVLILEADATNGDDPLALGNQALDLTIDDASQGFRRVTEQFQSFAASSSSSSSSSRLPPFRTLRVFLGNSLETSKTGGGHEYTLRHRIRYAREVDVLIDSRAPVLQEILNWCNRVTTTADRIILFQTSSRQYFLSLQLVMKQYGYRICDPLDWKLASQLEETTTIKEAHEDSTARLVDRQVPLPPEGLGTDVSMASKHKEYDSLLQILMEDSFLDSSVLPPSNLLHTPSKTTTTAAGSSTSTSTRDKSATAAVAASAEETKSRLQKAKEERKRHAMKLARLPRLVYYGTTAETVNAVEALLNAGAADIANCCALLDKEEGTHLLTRMIQEKTNMVQQGPMEWGDDQRALRKKTSKENSTEVSSSSSSSSSGQHSSTSTSPATTTTTTTTTTPKYGLHIISSSEIYDDLFRQVRQWTRMGYTAANIQMELDTRFHEILQQSKEVHDKVTEVTTTEAGAGADGRGDGTSGKGSASPASPTPPPLPPLEDEDDHDTAAATDVNDDDSVSLPGDEEVAIGESKIQ